jgi:hypothetical protein
MHVTVNAFFRFRMGGCIILFLKYYVRHATVSTALLMHNFELINYNIEEK